MIDATPPAIGQMIDVFNDVEGPVLAIEQVPRNTVSSYGIIDAEEIKPGVYRIRDLVEKPAVAEAPSDLAIIGRYILTPDIFPALEATARDRTGEIQLTNGLRRLLKNRPIYGCRIDGVRHDTGNKLGFLEGCRLFRAAATGSRRRLPRVHARGRRSTLVFLGRVASPVTRSWSTPQARRTRTKTEASAFEPSVDEAAVELALEPLPPPESDPDFFG